MKRIMFLFIGLIFCNLTFGQNIEVVVEPKEPVINETFFVTFKIRTSDSEEPYISFTPYGASVLGKRSQGLSISTVVINGKFTTTKEQAVVYELLAERAGQVYLRNVKVEMSGKTIPVNEVRVNVLNEARRIPDAFMEAEASKTKVYIGEGIDVNYYLYFKSSISANDVKEFPKLNKFIKRFHHINSPVETVQYKGQVFKRILAYSARLYPEKVGSAVLDPMKISVQIIENEYNGFGFGNQRYKNKDLASSRIEIEVLPLPAEGVPPGFTGLVGEHEFNLTVPKTKYLVNEPVELKLEVKGKGAVENFDAPVIYNDANLEQFDTKSEVTELGTQAAKKVFEYTLLARGPLSIKARDMSLAYFDPISAKYIEKKIPIPALEVSGSAANDSGGVEASSKEASTSDSESEKGSMLNSFFSNTEKKNIIKNQISLVGPNVKGHARWFEKSLSTLNICLVVLLVALTFHWLWELYNKNNKNSFAQVKNEIKALKKNGLSYPELYRVISLLDKNGLMSNGGVSILQVIDESSLEKDSKAYFKNALNSSEGGSYAQNKKNTQNLKFDKKHFNDLMKKL